MEIAASGPFGISAVNSSSNIATEGGVAFAAVLVGLGSEGAPAGALSATFAGLPSAKASMAAPGLSFSGGLAAETETFALANATPLAMTPEGELEVALTLAAQPVDGEGGASPDLLSPGIPDAREAALLAPTGTDASLNSDATVANALADAAPALVQVKAEPLQAPFNGAEAAAGEVVPADDAGADIQREAGAALSVLVVETAMPVAPLAQPSRAQDKADVGKSSGSATASPAKAQFEAGQTSAEPAIVTEGADEPFARLLQNDAAPDRPVSPPTAAATPLPSGQAPGPQPSAPAGLAPPAAPVANLATAAPVPVAPAPPSDPHPAMPFRADKVAREMGLEIARRVSAGSEELVIRLDPAELGRINIRMTVNEQGQLRAVVSADAPSVVEAIRSDIAELTRALEQAGVRTDGQSFRFDRGAHGDADGQWQQRYQQKNHTPRAGEEGSFADDDDPTYRPMATNGRLNMMA